MLAVYSLGLGVPFIIAALAIEQALAAADETLLPRLPLLGTVLGIPIEDNELTAGLDP